MKRYSYCVHLGKLDIVEVSPDLPGTPLATTRDVGAYYTDYGVPTTMPLPLDTIAILKRPAVSLRVAHVRVSPYTVTLIGEPWDGYDPPEEAARQEPVVRHRLKQFVRNWAPDSYVNALREMFDAAPIEDLRAILFSPGSHYCDVCNRISEYRTTVTID